MCGYKLSSDGNGTLSNFPFFLPVLEGCFRTAGAGGTPGYPCRGVPYKSYKETEGNFNRVSHPILHIVGTLFDADSSLLPLCFQGLLSRGGPYPLEKHWYLLSGMRFSKIKLNKATHLKKN